MIKKLLYVGLAMILAAILILLVIATPLQQNFVSSLLQNLTVSNVTIHSDSFNYTTITLYNKTLIFAAAQTTNYANFYLFNTSAFNIWEAAVSSNTPVNGFNEALSLMGSGAFVIYDNVLQATVPFNPQNINSTSNPTPLNQTNATTLYTPGTYYFVIDNTNGSASQNKTLSGSILYYQPTKGGNVNATIEASTTQFRELAIVSIVILVLFVVGIALSLYGYIKKPKAGSPEDIEQKQKSGMNVDELYKGTEKKKRSKKGTS